MSQTNPTQPTSTAYKTFGIISLILGILAFVFSFIPCLGMYAMFPGILGLVLGLVGFLQARKANAGKGMVITGIILSLLGTCVAVWQFQAIGRAVHETSKSLDSLNKTMDSSMHVMDSSIHAADSSMKALEKASN